MSFASYIPASIGSFDDLPNETKLILKRVPRYVATAVSHPVLSGTVCPPRAIEALQSRWFNLNVPFSGRVKEARKWTSWHIKTL